MFQPSSRTTSHPVMAQQGAAYFGYYPQQAPHQYHTTEFNCNFQPIVPPSQVPEGFPSPWYNSMYMAQGHHSSHPSTVYQQRGGYEDWSLGSSISHGLTSGAPSPVPLYSVPPSSSTSSTNSTIQSSVSQVKPPLTPSPCAMANGAPAEQTSPYFPSFYCKGPSEFGEAEGGATARVEGDVSIPDVSLEPHKSSSPALRPQQPRSPYEWMKKSYQTQNANSVDDSTFVDIEKMTIKGSQEEERELREGSWKIAGKTRTKDKYRVVYSDHQRLELEKEFMYSRYITIRRKSELASMLGLSERQVKIWFQNRRAKERKQMKKNEIANKEKIETGLPYHHHTAPLHALGHHHHQPTSHPASHLHAHSLSHLNQHHAMGAKPPPSLMMDVKPNIIGMD